MPTEHPIVCRTLLTDGQTRCSASIKPGRQSCAKHSSAYDASYERYKRAENAAKDLRLAAQTKRGDVHTIPPEEIEPRIESICAYIKALECELQLRREHDVRFIGNPDEGHLKRLDALEKQLTHHRDIVEALRPRLQRLKPVGESGPPKPRRHHRHSLSDPTPQPAPSVTRPSRRRSHGQPKQRKGAHGKSRSDQNGSNQRQMDHLIIFTRKGEGEVEEVDEFDHLVKPSGASLRVLEDARVDALALEEGYSGGGSAEQDEDEGRQEESTAVAAAGCADSAVPSDDVAAVHPTVDVANASPPPPSLIEPDGSRMKPTNGEGTSQEYPENDDISAGRSVAPSPLPRIVGEYPRADPEYEETGGGMKPGTSHHGRYLKYALTAILPATVIVLNRTLATIRDRASKI